MRECERLWGRPFGWLDAQPAAAVERYLGWYAVYVEGVTDGKGVPPQGR